MTEAVGYTILGGTPTLPPAKTLTHLSFGTLPARGRVASGLNRAIFPRQRAVLEAAE